VGALQIARILGIPIYVHYTWLIVFGLVSWSLAAGYFPALYPDLPAATYWIKGVAAALLLFASVLIHELGHSIVALRHGIGIASITLFIFGGVARLENQPPTARIELEIALAGPLASLLLAGLFALATAGGWGTSESLAVTSYLGRINLLLALFNLVPALPLDGGRVLRALLWRQTDRVRATRIASGVGTFFAYLLMAVGFLVLVRARELTGLWYVFLGWFLKEGAESGYQQAKIDQALSGVRVRDLAVRDCRALPAGASLDEAVREAFLRFGYGGFPVEEGGRVIGLLSLADVKSMPREEWERTPVRAAMQPLSEKLSVREDDEVLPALAKMAASGLGRLLVLDANGSCTGLLTHRDVLRRLRTFEQLA
jgi:Zn-dependent protease/CBS domain-containing protein